MRQTWTGGSATVFAIVLHFGSAVHTRAEDAPTRKWLSATAYAIPKETTNQGSGYFSIVTGKNGRQYIGTAKYGVNSYLVEFNPKSKAMKTVVDTHKEIV